jgi:hypothetical protein
MLDKEAVIKEQNVKLEIKTKAKAEDPKCSRLDHGCRPLDN